MKNKLTFKAAFVRINEVINLLNIVSLEEYTIGSVIGYELTELYSKIITEVIDEEVNVLGREIANRNFQFLLPPRGKFQYKKTSLFSEVFLFLNSG